MIDDLKFHALLHWLAVGAPPQTDYRATMAEPGRRNARVRLDFKNSSPCRSGWRPGYKAAWRWPSTNRRHWKTTRTAAAGGCSHCGRAAGEGSDIRFRAAYHVGEIHYGNIGGQTRLDSAAIGAAVNLASRLLQTASATGTAAICSADFARLVPDRARDLGGVQAQGFADPQPVFDVS